MPIVPVARAMYLCDSEEGANEVSECNSNSDAEETAETFQEGTAPVQEFTSLAIPVLPETPLEARLGRPAKSRLPSSEKMCNTPQDQQS
jgi:hypothetical protein